MCHGAKNSYNILAVHILFVLAFIQLSAQAPDTVWARTYGGYHYDYGESVQQTLDGGYIIAGFTYSYGAGYDDVYLIKTDENGDTIWTKTYGYTGYDAGFSVEQTLDSGYIITGGVDLTPTTGQLFLLKTDYLGDTVWTRKFGGSGKEEGYAVQQTFDGGFAAAGPTSTYGPGYCAYYLIRTDSLGNLLWTKTYGGDNWDFCFSMQQTADSGFILYGFTTSFGAGGQDVYLVKTDIQGDTLWTKTYGGPGDDGGCEIIQTADGGYALTGYTSSYGAGSVDVLLIKTNAQGELQWLNAYGSTGEDVGESLCETADGGYIIVGTSWSFGAGGGDAYIVKTDSNGDTLWTRVYGGVEWDGLESVQQLPDFGYIIVGTTYSFGSDSGSVWLLRMEPDTLGINERLAGYRPRFWLNAYPNPCRNALQIEYFAAGNDKTGIDVYDVAGKIIQSYSCDGQTRGYHEKTLDLTDLPRGVYFVRLNAKEHAETRKIIVLK